MTGQEFILELLKIPNILDHEIVVVDEGAHVQLQISNVVQVGHETVAIGVR